MAKPTHPFRTRPHQRESLRQPAAQPAAVMPELSRLDSNLSRQEYCHQAKLGVARLKGSPNLTPFTPEISLRVLKEHKSVASTDFATPALGREDSTGPGGV